MRRLSAVIATAVPPFAIALLMGPPQRAERPRPCLAQAGIEAAACSGQGRRQHRTAEPLPAGDAPAFLLASVQPLHAPGAWRRIYQEVERCAGKRGDYDAIRWSVMEAPLRGPKGPTYAFTIGRRIVLVRGDTTYLRHEMLHHVLEVAGWHPRQLGPGEQYTIADLHPMPLFGLCTGGH
jgi:hypothetical protein